MVTPSEHELWGWESFFEQVGAFVRDSGRQLGNCNEQYAEYVVERLEMLISRITTLKNHIEDQLATVAQQNREVVTWYQSQLEELLECLRALSGEWHEYLQMREPIGVSSLPCLIRA